VVDLHRLEVRYSVDMQTCRLRLGERGCLLVHEATLYDTATQNLKSVLLATPRTDSAPPEVLLPEWSIVLQL